MLKSGLPKPVCLVILYCTLLFTASAQWNADPMRNTPVAKSSFSEYVFGNAVSDGNGGSIIPMIIFAGNGNYHVYIKRISFNGELLWGDSVNSIPVCTTPYDKGELTAVSDGNGGAILGWFSYTAAYDTNTIFLQHIDASGQPTWQQNGIKVASVYHYNMQLRMCSDGNGGAYFSWGSEDWATNLQCYAQHINAAGVTTWANKGVLVCNAPGFRNNQGIVNSGSGVIVMFADTRNDVNGTAYSDYWNTGIKNWDIYAQKLNDQGVLQWTDTGVIVCNAPGTQLRPFPTYANIVTDGSDGGIIAFHDTRKGNIEPDVYAQRLNSNGVRLWNDTATLVRQRFASFESLDLASICADNSGGAVITWHVYDFQNPQNFGTHAQRIGNSGVALWQTNGVSLASGGLNPGFSSVAQDDEGNYVVSGVHSGLLTRVFNAHKINGSTGEKLWGNGVTVSSKSPRQGESYLTKSVGNSFIMAWSDDRASSTNQTDVYAAKVLSNGTLAVTVSNTFTTKANGNWNNGSSWVGDIVPPASADVVIRHHITVTQNTSCKTLKAEGAAANVYLNPGVVLSITNQ